MLPGLTPAENCILTAKWEEYPSKRFIKIVPLKQVATIKRVKP